MYLTTFWVCAHYLLQLQDRAAKVEAISSFVPGVLITYIQAVTHVRCPYFKTVFEIDLVC